MENSLSVEITQKSTEIQQLFDQATQEQQKSLINVQNALNNIKKIRFNTNGENTHNDNSFFQFDKI